MLNNLKREIRLQQTNDALMESMIVKEASDDLIKDTFLNDYEVDLLGAENDPEVKALVTSIPEYEDYDEELEMEVHIKAATESLIETNI